MLTFPISPAFNPLAAKLEATRGGHSPGPTVARGGVFCLPYWPPHKASPYKLRHPLTEGGHPVAPGDLQPQWGKASWPRCVLVSSCWPPGRNRTLGAEGSTFMRDYPGLHSFLLPNTCSLAQNEDGGSFLPVSLFAWNGITSARVKKKKKKTKHNYGFLESKKAIK